MLKIRTLLFLLLLTIKGWAQLAPCPTLATSNVTEAAQYGVMYEINLPTNGNLTSSTSLTYAVNASSVTTNYNRVAYFMQLDNNWVWVSMNKFNTTNGELIIPYSGSPVVWQNTVSAMNVVGSSGSNVTNTVNSTGNIEIWADCYSTGNALSGIGGDPNNYDFNDTRAVGSNCYGSFQVHNYNIGQTIFAYNQFIGGGNDDLGIGNNSGNSNKDWTFMSNAANYTVKKLYILVNNIATFPTQPSTVTATACKNGTLAPYTVSVSAPSNTIQSYTWYLTNTSSATGGTAIGSTTTSAATNSISIPTGTAGSYYVYCVVNTANGISNSEVSGVINILDPVVSISTPTTTICSGSSLTLTAGGNPATSNGVVTNTLGYTIHSFTSNGVFTTASPLTVEYLIVAGGGGGGAGDGGGGGGGGVITGTTSISAGTYSIVVGAGGVGGVSVSDIVSTLSGQGGNSSFATYTAIGGGRGGMENSNSGNGGNGGTGGGAGGANQSSSPGTGTSGQGYSGGFDTPGMSGMGGGGGAGAVGGNGSGDVGGNGGAGITSSITGVTSAYGGGGAGSGRATPRAQGGNGGGGAGSVVNTTTINGSPGVNGTGGGGGGGTDQTTNGGAGGSGIVIIRYQNASLNSYTWSTGSSTNVAVVSPTANTTYSVSGSNTQGCVSNTATLAVTVNTVPVISITGTNAICNGGNTTLTGSGASTYTWNTGTTTNTINVAPTANTSYTLSGRNAANCQSSTTLAVTVYSLPVVSIAGTNTLCTGGSILLTGSGASSYVWSNSSTNSTISVAPTSNTTYTLNGVSSQGCSAATAASLAVTVYSLPVLTASSSTTAICPTQTVTLSGSGASTYTWIGVQNAQNITVSPTITTTYSLSGTSSQGCIGNTPTLAITVNTVPVIAITGTNGVCSGSSITLTANGASTYTWTNPSATTNTVSVAPTSNTTYSVNGRSSAGCLGTTTVLAVTVYSLPTVSISAASSSVCNGQSLTLSANGASTYTWSTANSANSITVAPSANTTYTMRGTSSQGCLSSSAASLAVTVNTLPVLAITSATTAICNGQSLTLNANGASTYTWNTNNNSNTLSVSPSTTTTYSLTGTSVQGCNGNVAVTTITVYSLPVLSITGTNTLCIGQSITLNANGASSYTWNNSSNSVSINVTPTITTTYSLAGTSSIGCVGTPTTLAVTVYTLPIISISGNTFICIGETATLTAAGASTYTWSGNVTGSTNTVTPTTNSSYTATGTDSNGCDNSAIVTITVNAIPTLSISGNTPICSGASSTVTANGASTYTWSNGTNGAQVVITPTLAAGQYTFNVSGTSTAGCIGNSVDSLLVNALPSVTITGNAFVCTGGSTTLTANGASTYTWENGANTTSVIVTPSASIQYSVTGTSTAGCDGSTSLSITVVSLPTVAVTGNTVICTGESVTLTATGANTYSWSSGSTGSVVVFTPTANTSYTTVGEISQGCTDSTSTNIIVNALPILVLTPSVATICEGESLSVNASGATTYSWSTGATTSSISVTPTLTSSFTLTGTSQENCSSTTTLSVIVDACTALANREITSIEVFPNPGSGVYEVISTTAIINVEVYNTVGQKIVTTNSTINISDYANGVYFVRINLVNGQSFNKQIIKN